MNPYEEAQWEDAYLERLAILEADDVEHANRKAILDTRKRLGIGPPWSWGSSCARGFVSNARFDPTAMVIPRTNRATTKAWRKLGSS